MNFFPGLTERQDEMRRRMPGKLKIRGGSRLQRRKCRRCDKYRAIWLNGKFVWHLNNYSTWPQVKCKGSGKHADA